MKKVYVFSKKNKIDKNKTSLNDESYSIAKFRIGLGVCSFVFIFFIVFVLFLLLFCILMIFEKRIHIISFEPNSKRPAKNSFHELSVTSVSVDVIGAFWQVTKREFYEKEPKNEDRDARQKLLTP